MCMGVCGTGVLKLTNGDVYDGEWKDNKKNGRGEGERSWLLSERVRGRGKVLRACAMEGIAGETGMEMRNAGQGRAGRRQRSRLCDRSESERRIESAGVGRVGGARRRVVFARAECRGGRVE